MRYYEEEERSNYIFFAVGIVLLSIIGFFIYKSHIDYQAEEERKAALVYGNIKKFSETFGLPQDTVDVNGKSLLSRLAMSALNEPCDWATVRDLAEALSRDNKRRASAILYEYYDSKCGTANNATWISANIYEQIGDYHSALRLIERFIKVTEENPNGYYLRGRANSEIGNKEQAISDYLTAISIMGDPSKTSYMAYKHLSLAYESQGMNCEAASVLQEWGNANSNYADNQLAYLINSYRNKGNCAGVYSSGRGEFKQAVSGSDVIFANVDVNGRKGRFIVDTGASVVVLSNTFAKRAGLKPRANSKVLLSTANGIAYGNQIALNAVKIGDVEAQHVQGVMMQEADALPNGVDGLLGRSFLARFDVTFEKNKWSISTRN